MDWQPKTPHVQAAVVFLNGKATITKAELLEWDKENGQNLFNWDESKAAHGHRLHQAGQFIGRFKVNFGQFTVRKYHSVRPTEKVAIPHRAYYPAETVVLDKAMQDQVVSDIQRRMEALARQLVFFELTKKQKSALLVKMGQVLGFDVPEQEAM